jgi:hypothetical protein
MPPKTKGNRKGTQSTDLSPHAESDKSTDVTTLNTPLELPFHSHTYFQRKRNQSAPPVFHLNAASVAKAAAS